MAPNLLPQREAASVRACFGPVSAMEVSVSREAGCQDGICRLG